MATDTSSLRLIVGRSNLSITVFVPWDCENKCPFCTTKSLYHTASEKTHVLNPVG